MRSRPPSAIVPALFNALAVCLLAGCHVIGPQTGGQDPFFTPVSPVMTNLPADGFYPHGRQMPFMGYSGVPSRDLTNGFTVAGPSYGNDRPYVITCASNGWPVVAHISHGPRFTDKDPAKNYKLDEPSLRTNVAAEVRALAPLKNIAWWAVTPEELRCWRKNEMQYLAIVCDTIRSNDPLRRPIYIYNPNNRDAGSLAPIARQVDVIGKGCYVNSWGAKRNRAWVGWSIDQEVAAIKAAGRPGAIPIIMPELCQDPPPSEEKEIRNWVRHDVYLGLAKGAKGLCLWSLFRHGSVRKTWSLWYNAYAECGRELNGERGLAQVFLFGAEPVTKLDVKPTMASEQKISSWTAREFVYSGDHWLFLINSANDPTTFAVTGWPRGTHAENAFDSTPIDLHRPLCIDLPPYGVTAIRYYPGGRK